LGASDAQSPSANASRIVERFATGVGVEAGLYDTVVVRREPGSLAGSPDRGHHFARRCGTRNILYRHGARPGDRVLVTGTLGDSALDWHCYGRVSAPPSDYEYLVGRHRLPIPRVEAGRAIGASRLATAMLDLSDGLASDLAHLCRASHVGATIRFDQLPLSTELSRLAASSGLIQSIGRSTAEKTTSSC